MADYYPLISRAVAGLEKNNGENRRALYERARAALLAQLRGVTPALNESDITRERLALEESVRKVEAERGRDGWRSLSARLASDQVVHAQVLHTLRFLLPAGERREHRWIFGRLVDLRVFPFDVEQDDRGAGLL